MTTVTQEKSSMFSNSMKLLGVNAICALVIFGLAGINNLPTWRIILFILVFGILYRTSDFVRQAFGVNKTR
jgi:hypothetical protein